MKLRKLLATAAMALLVGAGANAQNPTVDEVRIYINPGHGSWGPNNRHMATIGHSPISTADPDTTDFFESNTNLRKGLALLEKLHEYGVPFDKTKNQINDNPNRIGAALDLTQNLVMSHVKCGPYPYDPNDKGTTSSGSSYIKDDQNNDFNRTLTTIAAEVEANDFDMFVSIHSNANVDGDGINYLYFIYRTNYGADEATSVAMSEKCWDHRILDRHTQWSHYDNLVANGSVKIASGNYIVLAHSVPGFLVEGYFHTYQPARHRYMNFDMCRLEGVDYARGVADYFGWEKEKTGDIVGIVRDKHEKFSDALYTPKAGTYDVYKPLNGVVVKLMKGEEEVAVDTTDVNYNGLFAFRNVEPGDYTVKFSHADYKADSVWTTDKAVEEVATSLPVTVKAAVTAYPTAFLENVTYVPATMVYVNYPDSTAGKNGYILKSKYNMYDDGTCTSMATELEGKTVRRTILRDGIMYVLAVDAENKPSVYLFDINTDALVKTLGTTATVGDILPISDIALTAEGVLVGINKCNQAYGGENNVTAYKWENGEDKLPEGEAQVWWTNNFAGNWSNGIAGETMTYDGTLEDGNFIYVGTTTASSGNTRIIKAAISDGAYLGYMRNNQDGTYLTTSYLGENYNMTLSPNADDQIVFDSEKVMPFEIQLNAADAGVPTILGHMAEGTVVAEANNASYFKYTGKSVMVATDVNAEGKVAGLKMFDISEGIANAAEITLNGTTLTEPVEAAYAAAHGELTLTLNEITGVTEGAEINLALVVDGTVAKFTATPPPATKVTPSTGGTANPFAYALSSEVADNTLKVKYSLNAVATTVKVIVKNSAEEVVATADGAVEAGAHTAEISLADFADDNYTWEVEVTGAEKTQMETFFATQFYHPRGIDVDNNIESPAFGHVYITEGMSTSSSAYYPATRGGVGLFIFDPQMNGVKNEKTGNYAFMSDLTYTFISYGADLARVRVAEDGRIFVSRCNNAGDYILYAPSHDDLVKNNKFTSLLAGGELNADTYEYHTADGFLAAGNIGMDIKGAGEDLKLMTIAANKGVFGFNASGSRVDEYALGEADVLPTPTKIETLSGYTIAPQVTNVEYDNQGGVWYCQYRGTPSDTEPALIYVDANGEQRYFEGAGGMARGGGGIRISPDGTQIAISTSKTTFSIYDLEYLEDGGVEIVEKTRVTHGIGTNCYDIAWDLAGNIYICGNSGEWMKGFALPRTEAFTTKAASKYAFWIGEPSAIDEIDAEDTEVPVEYYNLQGVKVTNPENGIFIKKQGKKVTKVVL